MKGGLESSDELPRNTRLSTLTGRVRLMFSTVADEGGQN
jgi:hypothetical protein